MKLPFLKSSKTTEAEVSEKIFGVEINKDLIAQLIKIYIENSHPGTKAQKNRSAVRGGGKKPWPRFFSTSSYSRSIFLSLSTGVAIFNIDFYELSDKIFIYLNSKDFF